MRGLLAGLGGVWGGIWKSADNKEDRVTSSFAIMEQNWAWTRARELELESFCQSGLTWIQVQLHAHLHGVCAFQMLCGLGTSAVLAGNGTFL